MILLENARSIVLLMPCRLCVVAATVALGAVLLHAQNGSTITEPRTGMPLVEIRAGAFVMGSPATETGRNNDERVHEVTLSRPFTSAASR